MNVTPGRFVVGALAAALAAPLAPAHAQPVGVRDQVNNPSTGTTYSCGGSGASLFQSFTPKLDTLVGAEVFMRAGGAFPADGHDLTLSVRDGAPTGTVLATNTVRVPGPLAPGASTAARFDLAPVSGVAGRLLVLELHSATPAGTPAATVLSYFGRADDPYGRGHAYGCSGNPAPANDYNFVSYAAEPSGPQLCPQVAGRVPAAAVQRALANPDRVAGYNTPRDPGKAVSPWNPPRTWLTIERVGDMYHPVFNRLVFRAGCP